MEDDLEQFILYVGGIGETIDKQTLEAAFMPFGVIKNVDPHLVALRFYTPIYYLLQKYDMYPDREEDAKNELVSMVTEFCETYKG